MMNFGTEAFNTVIAAVRNEADFERACHGNVEAIFDLSPDLLTVANRVKRAHDMGKKLLIHIDLATGIGKDESGLSYLSGLGIDGIISTRVNMIRTAHELGLFTVQRFFIVDSHSITTSMESLKASHADTIEIMPGVVFKVIEELHGKVGVPIIAGGLIESREEIDCALRCGASAVSTGKAELWS